jgi:hypothetical protein
VAIESLAQQYANRPVIVLEYNIDTAPLSRLGRWFAAFGGNQANLPLTMFDSGDQINTGYYAGIYSTYQSELDYALTRPPRAEILAAWERLGDQVRFSVQLKNLSGKILSTSNDATLHAIVYEENHVQYTNRFVRSAVAAGITSLANGATGSYTLTTPSLSGVDWNRLHFLVLVDYHPSAGAESYDMLQAALATSIGVEPDELVFMVDPQDDQAVSQMGQIIASAGFGWAAAPEAAWISVKPASGTLPVQPTITVNKSLLTLGWQTGSVSIRSAGGTLLDAIVIRAYLGDLQRMYLPIVKR